jgi:hypothetical protein
MPSNFAIPTASDDISICALPYAMPIAPEQNEPLPTSHRTEIWRQNHRTRRIPRPASNIRILEGVAFVGVEIPWIIAPIVGAFKKPQIFQIRG